VAAASKAVAVAVATNAVTDAARAPAAAVRIGAPTAGWLVPVEWVAGGFRR
jgi:hypothetical protein